MKRWNRWRLKKECQKPYRGFDWFKLNKESPVIGQKLGSFEIRKRTQISIIAVLRNNAFIPNPSSEFVFEEEDTCVVSVNRKTLKIFWRLSANLFKP